jgi:hypothetical protein
MIAKIVKFKVASGVQDAPGSFALAHSNDNTKVVRAAVALHRRRRRILACHWRPVIGGGLECYWNVEPANGAATQEPDQCRRDAGEVSGFAHAA